jgi:hypothetical protein
LTDKAYQSWNKSENVNWTLERIHLHRIFWMWFLEFTYLIALYAHVVHKQICCWKPNKQYLYDILKHKYFTLYFILYLVFSEFTSRPVSLLASSRASAVFFMILGWT